jgi:thiamine biosynthesis protein ThiI
MDRVKGKSLVTGESLGQVASQTIENIAVINEGVPYPILRPLIGMDKREIIDISQRIGAYETSIRPFEDCCSLFSPKDPVTRARLDRVKRQESFLDIEGLMARALEQTETIDIK